MRIIATDVDGVLLNWIEPFQRWMKNQDYKLLDNHLFYEGLSKEEVDRKIKEFNSSAQIGFLPSFRDSVKIVYDIHKKLGYHFICISSMGLDPYAKELRKQNIKRFFGSAILDIVIIDLYGDKTEELKKIKEVCGEIYWIEDNENNALIGSNLGFTTFLMDSEYNRSDLCKSIKRVNTWKEIYQILSKDNK